MFYCFVLKPSAFLLSLLYFFLINIFILNKMLKKLKKNLMFQLQHKSQMNSKNQLKHDNRFNTFNNEIFLFSLE
jgi:hypothetical protein